MAEEHYDLVFHGQLAPGFDFEQVKRQFAAACSMSEEQAERTLKRQRVVLKRSLDRERALHFQSALRKTGILVSLEAARTHPAPALNRASESAPAPQGRPEEQAGNPPPGKSERIPLEFKGSGSEYFRIWLVNVLLSILTLGIYSAWAKVRRKQYVYGSMRLNGAGFEYLADPVKILKGRLLVVGFFVASWVAAQFVPILNPILGLCFTIAFPWMIIRSLAFNARNSAFKMVKLAEKEEELVAVLVHEIGHVVHRHGMRAVIQNSMLAFAMMAITGDVSGTSELFIGLPVFLTQLSYSRTFEREADRYAFDYLRSHGIPAVYFARLMRRIQKEADRRHGMSQPEWTSYLSTHPRMDERLLEFEKKERR
ncbi:MAG: DUF898 family protein [Desulfobacteraceae bacterium]|nr:MAG: DUF898 family protein [Desulfobacteraceae bacterium]